MKFFVTIIVFLAALNSIMASHIVGGEFQLKQKRGGSYDIHLNLYFDAINGNPQAIDNPLNFAIFRKRDNLRIITLDMNLAYDAIVPYENPKCAVDELETRLLQYVYSINFDRETYSDPEGYYMVYDRCCRNDIIDNIVSPENTGMLFYLEFPPIYKPDGSLTNYSSPIFNPIFTRYACRNENFYMDFGATDIDGDSLVFHLVTPLSGNSSSGNPVISGPNYLPQPYPEVNWMAGYSAEVAIQGTPNLTIDTTNGMLSLFATDRGLFVFSVECTEYRNGVKIGALRRDFQIYVNDCDPNDPPSVLMENPDTSQSNTAFYKEGDTIRITKNGNRCFDFLVTDDIDPRNNEKITFTIIPRNFTPVDDFSFEGGTGIVGGPGDTLKGISMCWPECEYVMKEPYILDVVVADDGCILPKTDTITLMVLVEEVQNSLPELFWTFNGITSDSNYLNLDVYIDSLIRINLEGKDLDTADVLSLKGLPQDFDITQTTMQFSDATATGGSVKSDFVWQPGCEEFVELGNKYQMKFILDDNHCKAEYYNDTLTVDFNLKEVERKIIEFEPSNVFTPNGDGINDYFTMPTLPIDQCGDAFVNFEIFNRWGRKVYATEDRTFIWTGSDVPDGVYYYLADYEKSKFKGWIQLTR